MLKRLMMGLTLLAGLMLLAPVSQAEASNGSWWSKWRSQRRHKVQRPRPGRGGGPRGVPELDPGAAGGALVLLVGGVAYIVSRRREDEDLLA